MTHPPKERPLRPNPVTAFESNNGGAWILVNRGGLLLLNRRDLPALARLVAKMQAAETKRKAKR